MALEPSAFNDGSLQLEYMCGQFQTETEEGETISRSKEAHAETICSFCRGRWNGLRVLIRRTAGLWDALCTASSL